MELSDELFAYIEEHIDAEPEELHQLMRKSNLRKACGRMCSGHHQGRLLKMLTLLTGATRILELGTFTGYATLCLAEGVAENLRTKRPDAENQDSEVSGSGSVLHTAEYGSTSAGGRIDTIEIFDENEDFLREVFGKSPNGEMVNLIIGDALDVMPDLKDESYDLIFIDANKRLYPEYYAEAKRLLHPGGCIIADNTLWDGHVTDERYHDAQTEGIRRFNDIVAADTEVEKIIIPLRDGLTIIRKR